MLSFFVIATIKYNEIFYDLHLALQILKQVNLDNWLQCYCIVCVDVERANSMNKLHGLLIFTYCTVDALYCSRRRHLCFPDYIPTMMHCRQIPSSPEAVSVGLSGGEPLP